MSTPAQLAQNHWNHAPLFYSEEARYRQYPWLYEAAEFRHHAGECVLEIGCGTGCDLLQFAKHGAKATGIDITKEHLRLARERVGDLAEVREADARSLPFPAASFDYIYSHGVLHHSDEPRKIAAEILRVLKPGGRFNIHCYSLFSYATVYGIKHFGYSNWKRRHIENSDAPVYVALYTAPKFRNLFPRCKLSFAKYHLPEYPTLERLLGWYLVATGQKQSG